MDLWLGERDRFTTYHTDIYTYVRDLFREEGGRLQMLIHILLHAGVFAPFFPSFLNGHTVMVYQHITYPSNPTTYLSESHFHQWSCEFFFPVWEK